MRAPASHDAMIERFIFTVATGRCGQASFTEWVARHVPDAYPAFEAPHARTRLPGAFGDLERHFRRRFVETDALLGRGRVLDAFVAGDDAYIERVAAKRMAMAERWCARAGKRVYIDVSKFFARGLHIGFMRKVPRFGLVILLRDPLANMRSFLNRDKNFLKDNPPTDAARNHLRLDPKALGKGELYLWAWCEMYLRYLAIRDSGQVTHAVEVPTRDLDHPERVAAIFGALDLAHTPLGHVSAKNTNAEAGRGATTVTAEDVRTFERFMNRLPAAVVDRLGYLKSYRPRAAA
jgi:hypothetical protein